MASPTGITLPANSIYDDKMRLAAMSNSYTDEPEDSNISTERSVVAERKRKVLIALAILLAVVLMVVVSAVAFVLLSAVGDDVKSAAFSPPYGTMPTSRATSVLPQPSEEVRTSLLPPNMGSRLRKRVIVTAMIASILVLLAIFAFFYVLYMPEPQRAEEKAFLGFAVEEEATAVLDYETLGDLTNSAGITRRTLVFGALIVVAAIVGVARVMSDVRVFDKCCRKGIKIHWYLITSGNTPIQQRCTVDVAKMHPYPGLTVAMFQKSVPEECWSDFYVLQNGKILQDHDQIGSDSMLEVVSKKFRLTDSEPEYDLGKLLRLINAGLVFRQNGKSGSWERVRFYSFGEFVLSCPFQIDTSKVDTME